jgi:5-hydroxyisourate hydrolase-like protein (transthyretin family)
VTVHVDNTAPGAVPLSVSGGESWRNRNGYDVSWQNPPEPDRAPIVAAHWRLCRTGGTECTTGESAGSGIADLSGLAVPAPGEWELQMWREDAAGNQQPQNASIPVKLRFDPEPPQVGFEPLSASDPTRVSLKATDPLSGVAGGEIAISKVGSGVWQTLATTREGEDLTTRIDDASLPPGEYELRGTATDYAGNIASTTQMLDGEPMKVKLPLRTPMSLGAGILATRTTHRHGRRVKATVLVTHSRSRFGRTVTLAGHLVDGSGDPLGGAQVDVFALPREGAEGQVGTLTTDREGKFAYEVKAEASEELRFAYAGDATHLPAKGKVDLEVSGGSTLAVDRRHVLNGQAVTFKGRVRGRPLPATGKLVELQTLLSGKWQTFRTTRTEADGTWQIAYRFKRTCGLHLYPFRLWLPEEAGYPLTAAASHQVTVRVRGRPCATTG